MAVYWRRLSVAGVKSEPTGAVLLQLGDWNSLLSQAVKEKLIWSQLN